MGKGLPVKAGRLRAVHTQDRSAEDRCVYLFHRFDGLADGHRAHLRVDLVVKRIWTGYPLLDNPDNAVFEGTRREVRDSHTRYVSSHVRLAHLPTDSDSLLATRSAPSSLCARVRTYPRRRLRRPPRAPAPAPHRTRCWC